MAQFKVALRGGFSDRNRIKAENTTIQIDTLDERTRVSLSNATNIIVCEEILYNTCVHDTGIQRFIKRLYSDVYGLTIEWNKQYYKQPALDTLLSTIEKDEYDAVLTVIEYIAREADSIAPYGFYYEGDQYNAYTFYNRVFEKEYVGYRFVNGYITQITDSAEIFTIEDASSTQYNAVREHIDKALSFLSDRDAPDYANSIKESISAVERMCSIIVGKATSLGDALNNLQKKGVVIHPQLRSAFEKLFAYTNGASGIRHSGELGGADSTFEEAKFMLVSCCAFVNYLTGVMTKQN